MNRRLVAFADTSVGFTIRFIIVASWLALDTELRGDRCLSYVGREGSAAQRIADHNAWLTWVRAHEAEIKAHAVPGMETRLFDAVQNADVNKPTPVQRVFRGEGIVWNDDLTKVELARHGVTHEGGMPGYEARDWLSDIDKVGMALNIHATLVAKLIGYDGPIADRSTRSLPLSNDNVPPWWKTSDDYDLVRYYEP